MKFGGSSVSSPERWHTVRDALRRRLASGERPVVVHSALTGVTDALHDLVEAGLAHHRSGAGAVPGPPDRPVPGEGALPGPVADLVDDLAGRHTRLAGALGLAADELPGWAADVAELRRLIAGVALIGEATPRLRARVLAFGERMATRIGAAWLAGQGLPVTWLDARELLVARGADPDDPRSWLSAECDCTPDPAVQARLDGVPGIALTQGFTAATGTGETVVLGRGGSDTAAAYLAARLHAERLEIWSDVPGMFSADPRILPSARLLRRLDYAEAQEIATTGSRVLHPRSIPALRGAGVPLHLKSSLDPELPGTVIGPGADPGPARVKAISTKRGVVLLSMETLGMWQEVGFLARAAAVLADAGLSLDLVSTSESNVTVSLDTAANLLDEETLARVVATLEDICRVRVIRPCAAVSLVGERIRGMLHRLGPALEVFEEHRIHLVSQAASDLNLTVVVDEGQEERLVRELHRLLIEGEDDDPVMGPRWATLRAGDAPHPAPTREPVWWEEARGTLLALADEHPALYVYHLPTVRARARRVQGLSGVTRAFYAMKANPHPRLLRAVVDEGLGLECVSLGELDHVARALPELPPDRVVFTPNFAPREEYAAALERGVHVTLDALHPLEHWPDLFAGRDVLVRLDPGWGSGHHSKVVTGGRQAKFGIALHELDTLAHLLHRAGARAVGVHTHSGSGILEAGHWGRVAHALAAAARVLPHARIVNVGGGLGVPERRGGPALPLDGVGESLAGFAAEHPEVEIWIEPGRYLVAEAGVLLARVTQVKGKQDVRWIGVATGMNSLLRPALYGAFHEIVNLTRLDAPPAGAAQVVGPICESGDRLGSDRLLPETAEGDVILVATAGAYGRAMASRYNLRKPADEVVLEG
jgi:diaminopimelate decarboxylase/aspartate kinase